MRHCCKALSGNVAAPQNKEQLTKSLDQVPDISSRTHLLEKDCFVGNQIDCIKGDMQSIKEDTQSTRLPLLIYFSRKEKTEQGFNSSSSSLWPPISFPFHPSNVLLAWSIFSPVFLYFPATGKERDWQGQTTRFHQLRNKNNFSTSLMDWAQGLVPLLGTGNKNNCQEVIQKTSPYIELYFCLTWHIESILGRNDHSQFP